MSDVPAETLQEQTVQIGELIATVRAMEAKADAAKVAAEAAARKRVAKPRKPLASTEAYVAITVAVCLLVAFIAYLYYTH